MGQNHSHSIVLTYGNALMFQRKFFLRTAKNRLADPSENRALEFQTRISTIRDLLGFSDYRYRSANLSRCHC
jgi:hypothetical protein